MQLDREGLRLTMGEAAGDTGGQGIGIGVGRGSREGLGGRRELRFSAGRPHLCRRMKPYCARRAEGGESRVARP